MDGDNLLALPAGFWIMYFTLLFLSILDLAYQIKCLMGSLDYRVVIKNHGVLEIEWVLQLFMRIIVGEMNYKTIGFRVFCSEGFGVGKVAS